MKSITDIDISQKKVLIRVDFNVPLDENQNITDISRINAILPTLNYALGKNAKIILASHMGRPKGNVVPELSLAPVARKLSSLIARPVQMAPDCIGPQVEKMVQALNAGDILLLENLRFHGAEKKNDPEFAKSLASLCDVYVNDAFAVSHRAEASVVAITQYAPVSVAGLLLTDEMTYFSKAMDQPSRPLVAIIGGAKVSTKLSALENMLNRVDKIIVGGAMANTFLKSQGYDMGKSKIEEDLIDAAKAIMDKARQRGIGFYLPVDAVAAPEFDANAVTKIVPVNEIPKEWMALDIGPATSLLFKEALENAKTIVWNGPMGVFEMDAFCRGTMAMANSVAQSHALTIVGGGDTDAAIHKSGEADKITYISTGGGAFLTLLEGKTLPAVEVLKD